MPGPDAEPAVLMIDGLQQLFDTLKRRGYRVLGPTVRDRAIVYDYIASLADLPRGWTDEQDGGHYRLRGGDDVRIVAGSRPAERLAFIGVRACELAAIAIQDRVLIGGAHLDPYYRARRESAFIVAVNCSVAGGTCFCASMNTAPPQRAWAARCARTMFTISYCAT